jgi:hypothetical protein
MGLNLIASYSGYVFPSYAKGGKMLAAGKILCTRPLVTKLEFAMDEVYSQTGGSSGQVYKKIEWGSSQSKESYTEDYKN